MKIKELNSSAHIAWSPASVVPIYLACGSSAQQLDNSFSGTPQLSLYDLSINISSLEMSLVSTTTVPSKFNKLLWNTYVSNGQSSGVIVAGCENGSLYLYSAAKLMKNLDPLIAEIKGKHSGPVYTIDFNHHQENLLASGSIDSEILIWDVAEPKSPMTPGTKANIKAPVTSLAWNRQVEHIMAATFGGHAVVYDLRKSTSIIQIPESVSGIKACNIKWHPDMATQLIMACDDDIVPFAQVWDLRFAAAPLKVIQGHQRGIVAMDWCSADSNLFITSAKDNKIYIWNPNNNENMAELVGEFPSYNQWSFDVTWCPRDPSLVATSSIDGTVSVYSVVGGGIAPARANKFSAIADSFPGMEVPTEVPLNIKPQSIYLKYPPKWFCKRSGVSFGFGGRLLSWNVLDSTVTISQVVTEKELVLRNRQLEESLSKLDLVSYCQSKAENSILPQFDKTLWEFVAATFDPAFKCRYLELLEITSSDHADRKSSHQNESPLIENASDSLITSIDEDPSCTNGVVLKPICLTIGDNVEGQIRKMLLIGDLECAVNLCMSVNKTSLALILASHHGTELFTQTCNKVLQMESSCDLSELIRALVQEDIQSVVNSCNISEWKEALASSITYSTNESFSSLADCLGDRLVSEGDAGDREAAVLCFLCAGNLDKFASTLSKTKVNIDKDQLYLLDLVELLVVLQRAFLSTGRSATLNEGSAASAYMCQYASLLASQGALLSAVSYLNSGSAKGEMVELRDRLYKALGYETSSSILNRKSRLSSGSSQHQLAFKNATPPPLHRMSPPTMNLTPVGDVAPSFGHFMKPSLHSPPNIPIQAAIPSLGGISRNASASRYVSGTNVPNNIMNQPNQLSVFTPFSNVASGPPPFVPSIPSSDNVNSPYRPPPYTVEQLPQEMNACSLIPAAFDSSLPRGGWNDPPLLAGSRKCKIQAKAQHHEALSVNPVPAVMIPELPPQQIMGLPMVPNSNVEKPGSLNKGMPYQGTQSHGSVTQSEPERPKGPLPVEHQIIQDTFNRLREKGIQCTSNATARQRLEDLEAKLEILYDKLRSEMVEKITTHGLHQIVTAVHEGDYHRALQIHSSTISSGNFSQMSPFMPAIKLLLTTCMQCQVYLP